MSGVPRAEGCDVRPPLLGPALVAVFSLVISVGCARSYDDALGTFEADYGVCRETLNIAYAADGGHLYMQAFRYSDGREIKNQGAWIWNENERSVSLVGALEMPYPLPNDANPLWIIRSPRGWLGGTLMEINAEAGWAYRKIADDPQMASQPAAVEPPARSGNGTIVEFGSLSVHPYPGDALPKNGGILFGGYDEMVQDGTGNIVPGAPLWQLADVASTIGTRNPRLVYRDGEIPLHMKGRAENPQQQGKARWARVLLVPDRMLPPGERVELRVDGYAPRQLFRMQRQFPGDLTRITWTVSDEVAPLPAPELVAPASHGEDTFR